MKLQTKLLCDSSLKKMLPISERKISKWIFYSHMLLEITCDGTLICNFSIQIVKSELLLLKEISNIFV